MVVVRPATPGDMVEVKALLAETWHDTYDAIYGHQRVAQMTARAHSLENLARGLAAEGACFLVAEWDGAIAGTSFAHPDKSGAVHLRRLYVLPGHQRAGIGAALLARTLAAFPGATRVTLEVEPSNLKAIGFYEAQAFRITGRSPDCCGMGDDMPALIMERVL